MLNIDQSVLAITSFILKNLMLVSYRDKDLMLRNVDVTFDAPGSIQVRTHKIPQSRTFFNVLISWYTDLIQKTSNSK